MATSFTALSADYVSANIEAFLYVLWMSDHVHVEDARGMETFDDGGGGDADGRDEEFGAGVDDYGD